ncbi:MAG: serine/threonine-protein kinase [Vulcanimicrobiota bacterium]
MREPLQPGNTIKDGEYEITKFLGKSNYSHIYIVKDTAHHKSYLMKELFLDQSGDSMEDCTAHFLKVAENIASLNHKNLLRIVNYFIMEDRFFILREFIEGKTFEDILKKGRKSFNEIQIKSWFIQIFDTFQHLHDHSPPIYFGPLKASNLLVTPMGRVRFVDFGIDRFFPEHTRKEILAQMPPGFLPPEFAREEYSEIRSDIYVLGTILYYMLTGRTPGDSLDFSAEEGPLQAIIPKYEPAIRRALDSDPETRFECVEDFKNALLSGDSKGPEGPPEMITSIKELEINNARPNEEIQGKIHIMNIGGGRLAGRTWVDCNWLALSSQVFDGNDLYIGYTVTTHNMAPSVPHCGNIFIKSRTGEKVIPVKIVVESLGTLNIPGPLVFVILFLFPILYGIFQFYYLNSTLGAIIHNILSQIPSDISEKNLFTAPSRILKDIILPQMLHYRLSFNNFLLYLFPWTCCFFSFLFFGKLKKPVRKQFFPLYLLSLTVPLIWYTVILSLHWPCLPNKEHLIFLNHPSLMLINPDLLLFPFILISCFCLIYYAARATENVSYFYTVRLTIDYMITTLITIAYLAYFIYMMFIIKVPVL